MPEETTLQQRLQTRLSELRQEFTRGQDALSQAEARARELREMLLRIAGAIQVLEEQLDQDSQKE